MIPEAYKTFISNITEKTNRGEVKWLRSTNSSFILRTDTTTVEVGHFNDHETDLGNYYFKFYNLKKNTDAGFRVNNLEDEYSIMEKLHTVAAASAENVQDELTSFLAEFDE